MARIRLKATRSVQDRVLATLKASQPKSKSGDYTYHIDKVEKILLPKVRHVLTTGIEAFDGLIGGFPFRRICEVFGTESCGKTNLMVRTAIRAQTSHVYEITGRENGIPVLERLDPSTYDISVVYIDNEQSLDDDKIYCDPEGDGKLVRLDAMVGDADTVDLFFKIVDLTISTCAQVEKESGRLQFLVVVLDTVAATSTRDEMTREWGKQDYPRHAREWREGFRVMTRRLSWGNVCIICTNQVGDNIKQQELQSKGSKFKNRSSNPQHADYSTFGGKALRYYSTHRVFLFALQSKFKLQKESQFPAGLVIGFVSAKNRIRKPLREGRMVLLFSTDNDGLNGGLNNLFSKLECLIHLRHAEINDSGEIVFRFSDYGITPTTFGEKAMKTLDEEDDDTPVEPGPAGGRSKKRRAEPSVHDPRISARVEWPAFYNEHKADLDLLWNSAIECAFRTDMLSSDVPSLLDEDIAEGGAEGEGTTEADETS